MNAVAIQRRVGVRDILPVIGQIPYASMLCHYVGLSAMALNLYILICKVSRLGLDT